MYIYIYICFYSNQGQAVLIFLSSCLCSPKSCSTRLNSGRQGKAAASASTHQGQQVTMVMVQVTMAMVNLYVYIYALCKLCIWMFVRMHSSRLPPFSTHAGRHVSSSKESWYFSSTLSGQHGLLHVNFCMSSNEVHGGKLRLQAGRARLASFLLCVALAQRVFILKNKRGFDTNPGWY